MDFGINDDFIKQIGETIKPDSSALVSPDPQAQPEKVLKELHQYKGHLIRSSLSPEQENKWKALERARCQVQVPVLRALLQRALNPIVARRPATA